MQKKIILPILFMFLAACTYSQNTTATGRQGTSQNQNGEMFMVVEDGDTSYVRTLKPVSIYTFRKKFAKPKDQKRYDKLLYNVRKVYPYAHRAGVIYREEELKTAGMSKSERKSHMKVVEKRLLDEYGSELKGLNFSQGRILLKLVDRETGNTSYELVDDLRGTFRAWFYDGIAGLFGYDLKSEYAPRLHLEDRYIEEIVNLIEAGELTAIKTKNEK